MKLCEQQDGSSDTAPVEYPLRHQERGKADTASSRGHRSNNRNADVAIGAERIEQNRIIAAQHSHVDGRLT
jgi:hypothetical protein